MTEQQITAVEHQLLRRAHGELDHLLVRLETTAELAGTLEASEFSGAVRSLLDLFDTTLLPHIEWEEHVCFPQTDRLAATPWATRLLRFQHAQLRCSLDHLRADCHALREVPGHRPVANLRGHLYEFRATLTSHLEQEEHAILTLHALQNLLVSKPARPRDEPG